MERRELLAGLGALGVVGAGAATAFTNFDVTDVAAQENGSSNEGENEYEVAPLELPRFEAPGSTAGTETVPEPGRVTFITLFATWCPTCKREMEPLGTVADQVSDDVQFLSVTNEPVGQTVDREDVVEWWAENDGDWPLAHDEDLELTMALEAPGVPYTVVLDADNRITWADGGFHFADTMIEHIQEAK
jgi:thiol-disulfide isomerase/thioredoxin